MRLGLGLALTQLRRAGHFSPLKFAPALWLDAGSGPSLLTPSGVAGDTSPLSQWSDRSGNGRHLLQAATGYRPTLRYGVQNGLPGVLLDGVDDGMVSATEGGAALAQPAWEFVVYRSAADNYTNATVLDGGTQNESRLYISATTSVQVYAGSGGPAQVLPTTNQTFLAAVLFNGAASSLRLNDGPVVTGDAGSNGVHALSIGDVSTSGQCLNGYIFERVRVPAANIDAAGVAAMRAYLNTKWQVY